MPSRETIIFNFRGNTHKTDVARLNTWQIAPGEAQAYIQAPAREAMPEIRKPALNDLLGKSG
jgi:hypothetical protein